MRDVRAIVSTCQGAAGRFCWVDLAATDAARAKAFYGDLFGWTAQDETVNGGSFTRLRLDGRDIGSLYQLSARHRDHGVPSHWTSYVQVTDLDAIMPRIPALGGEVLVPPLVVPGVAKIALIVDSVGAQIGLLQPIGTSRRENQHG